MMRWGLPKPLCEQEVPKGKSYAKKIRVTEGKYDTLVVTRFMGTGWSEPTLGRGQRPPPYLLSTPSPVGTVFPFAPWRTRAHEKQPTLCTRYVPVYAR